MVLGTNGLLVDGCQVFPTSGPSSGSSSPKTIPLPNNSEIEIHKKRFVFTYPPKDVRPLLVSTPVRTSTHTSNGISNDMGTGTIGNTARKRTLRLSMIQSAEVFTPRPSADPRVNLKVLQSPLKPRAERSPVKRNLMDRLQEARDEEEEEGQIVLVEGDHPRVVEEEKDLVILEDIPFSPQPQATSQIVISPQTQTQSLLNSFPVVPVPAPVTPRRPVGPSRASLHKAVLIRSAQRAILKAEMEKEEEEEEREVEEAAVAGGYGSSTEEEGEGENEDGEEDDDDEDDDEGDEESQVSGWKKSLEMLRWPFRSGSASREEEPPTHDGDEVLHYFHL